MRVLLSTIGSRGDVQPVVGLASRLRALGQEVHLCVPPDFREWIEGLGMTVTPIGPNLRQTASASHTRPTPERLQQLADASVDAQFTTVRKAAEGCDVVVAGGALQVATRTIADLMGIPYIYASYCPVTLPSPRHAPPVYAVLGDAPVAAADDYTELWAKDAERYTARFGRALNAHRDAAGLPPVTDVRGHVFTDRPWLAADAVLAPWPGPADDTVLQTGAWILLDDRPLAPELEAFLEAGEPPVYLGFGSIRAPQGLSQAMITAARALGRRVIVLRGWADLHLPDDAPDCLAIGEVNQQALFKRVAAVVHTAARAPRPRPCGPARPRSSSRSTTTSTTSRSGCRNSRSEPRTHRGSRPPTRWRPRSSRPCNPSSPPTPRSSRPQAKCGVTAPNSLPSA